MKGLETSDERFGKNSRKKRSAVFKTCDECAGKGKVRRRSSVEEFRSTYGRSLAKYRDMQTANRMVRIGEAWVTSKVSESLSLEQEVALRRAAASPCSDCMGTGYEDCRSCDGYGKTECSARSCKNGYIETSTGGSLQGVSSVNRLEKCSTCRGKARIICDRCHGSGGKTCSDCDGTGEREMCRRCSGEGLSDCRKCRGSGLYRDVTCSYCKGLGQSKCTSCNGDGRKR